MRLLIKLRADADAAYETTYHNKLRGRFWRALEDTRFEEEHGNNEPMGFVFSNVFPWGVIAEGDERHVLIASPREELLTAIAESLQTDYEFNIGEMSFTVTDLSAIDIDVGTPGTQGTIETATGVVVRLYEHHREEYGIEDDHNTTPTYWRPEHTMEPLRDALADNLQHKHEQFAHDFLPGPTDVEQSLFQGYELIKTYALPVAVTTGTEIEIVLSKWRLDYSVRDTDHQRHLNLALDTGIGGRNGLGFGFVNVVDQEQPSSVHSTRGEVTNGA